MDLWVFGAAAAAGYIAKYWQNFSKDRDGLSGSELSKCEKHENPRSIQKKKLTKDTSTGWRSPVMYRLDSASEADVSSGDCSEKLGSSGNYDECNILSLSSLPPGVSMDEVLTVNGSGDGLSGGVHDSSGRPCTGDMDPIQGSNKKTSSLRTKHMHRHFIKPLNSLESCLMAQLYKQHTKMEEYVISVFPSPSTKMRPLLVTDGNQIINRVNSDCFGPCIGKDDSKLHKDEYVCGGVPRLPKISKLNAANKIKSKTREMCSERLSSSHKTGSRRHLYSQNGSFDQTYLFCLGISVGIASSLLASRREVNKLQDLLKQTENLVQDLQEELEMKDSLTVKDLTCENCESQDTCDNSLHYGGLNLLLPNADNSTKNDGRGSKYEKAKENSEDMNKIEAELEAELERLGLNMMNTSSLGGKLSNLVELDPDFVADFAQGELRAVLVNGKDAAILESDRDKSGTQTTHSGNYAVSPRELSLRLHEVIESQLEERVKQLEMALQNSQRKVQLMESERKSIWRKLSSSELRYSDEESPITVEDSNSMVQPLVMNLSGEALDAYNEAYEELMNINESEDDSPSTLYENIHERGLHECNQIMLQGGSNGATNIAGLTGNKERPSRKLCIDQLKVVIDHSPGFQKLLYENNSDNESSNSNDETEKQLIKQLVEKTRKGSPAVLNAQRVLFSMDD